MFDAIKNLKSAHRLAAFILVVIIPTLSAIVTTYLSTDDCNSLATQYNSLVKNYTETLSVNNGLIKDNNQKQKDFILIKKYLDSITNLEPKINTSRTIIEEPASMRSMNIRRYDENDTLDYSPAPVMMVEPRKQIIETKTIVSKMTKEQVGLLNKITDVIKKYEK